MGIENAKGTAAPMGGLAGWLLGRLQPGRRSQPRLELIERIALAPKQSLALVEAEGRRFLVATSAEGAPAFYPLEGRGVQAGPALQPPNRRAKRSDEIRMAGRVSW